MFCEAVVAGSVPFSIYFKVYRNSKNQIGSSSTSSPARDCSSWPYFLVAMAEWPIARAC